MLEGRLCGSDQWQVRPGSKQQGRPASAYRGTKNRQLVIAHSSVVRCSGSRELKMVVCEPT